MRLFIALLLISVNALATNWNDLEKNRSYKLKQTFQLPQVERSSSLIDLLKGDRFVLKAIAGLEMINVTMYTFQMKKCSGPELKTEMEIIGVENSSPLVEIGALISGDCQLEVFIENRDMFTTSLFE